MKIRMHQSGCMRGLLLGLASCLALQFAVAAQNSDSATGVTISEYDSNDLSPAGQVRAGRFFIDHERCGFFRIGFLPLLVVENVQIEIRSVACLTNALADLKSWHQPARGLRQMEMRNLEISLAGDKHPCLRAASARLGPEGTVRLSAVTVLGASGQSFTLPDASLQISGPAAGRLAWNHGGNLESQPLFDLSSRQKP